MPPYMVVRKNEYESRAHFEGWDAAEALAQKWVAQDPRTEVQIRHHGALVKIFWGAENAQRRVARGN